MFMKRAYWKDILRTIKNEKKRFICIALITALGVTMMCGLRAACQDLRYSADRFFDEQNLFDIRILSTLGITEEDLDALESLDDISVVDGGYSETVYTLNDNVKESVEVYTLSSKEMNQPYLLDGKMPEAENEILITENYLHETDKKIGDKIIFEEASESLLTKEYTITGTFVNAMDINSTEGSMGFRSTATTDYVGYVTTDAVDTDVYTVLYLKAADLDTLNCYTDEYSEKVDQIVEQIETNVKPIREKARYDEVYGAAMEEWQEKNQEMLDGFAEAEKEFSDASKKLADTRKTITYGKEQVAAAKKQQLIIEKATIQEENRLLAAEEELVNAENELDEKMAEYEEEKAKAEQEMADALEEINAIETAKWYVQDRTTLSGYSNVTSDAKSIQAIGNVFPILFLIIAILVSLTTITRMVEEERGMIGTYKALGFTNVEILMKYLIYAAAACLIGGMIGDVFGYVVLPTILFTVFRVMYTLPEYEILFDAVYGVGGIVLFEVGVIAASIYACERSLKKMPAKLMRPKSPKAGSRVMLEQVTFIWKRFSFLNKVTARNLFRYKKRLYMTIFGIAGCTALLLCGFTIKDTVSEMMPQQYEVVYQYDLMAVSSDDDYEELQTMLDGDKEVEEYISAGIDSVEILNTEGKKETVQLIVVPEGASLDGYIKLKDKKDHAVELEAEDIIITRNATRILEVSKGDTLTLQTQDLEQVEITISKVVENYFGNIVYMTENTYKEQFGKFQPNGALIQLSEVCKDQTAYTENLKREECVLSAVSTEAMRDEFSSAFALINMVVYVILILAAMLAFVVLFTLSNTNISERERELATIKVLGFYNGEVHAYVNKETWILTCIGILLGMPFGWLLGRYVMGILELPSLEFYIDLYPISYLYAAVITLVFALIVNLITNRTLNKINMVEALKSVE